MSDTKKFFFFIGLGLLIISFLHPLCFLYSETPSFFGNLVGRVTDSNTNLPVVGATVEATRGSEILASVSTDGNGMYILSGLISKPHLIKVKAPDFQTSVQLGMPISNQTVTLDFALNYPPGALIGRVVDILTGGPIPHATVDVLEEEIVIDSVQTNEEGYYIIDKANPRGYAIRASSPNFQSSIQNIHLLTNQTLTLDFHLEPFGNVIGQVIHAFTGQPIVGASIGMWQNNALVAATHSDEKGFFNLKGHGHCQLVVQALQFHDLEQSVQIFSMQTATANFTLVYLEPRPPVKVVGSVIHKRSGHRVHRIKWGASRDSSVIAYHIYRGEKLIGRVSAQDPLVFREVVGRKKSKTYHVTAVNAFEQESSRVSVTIK